MNSPDNFPFSDTVLPVLSLPYWSFQLHISLPHGSLLQRLFLSFMALSTVFHSINSPDNSPLFHSVLPILVLPYWSFQLYKDLFMKVSLSPDIILCGLTGLKAPTN